MLQGVLQGGITRVCVCYKGCVGVTRGVLQGGYYKGVGVLQGGVCVTYYKGVYYRGGACYKGCVGVTGGGGYYKGVCVSITRQRTWHDVLMVTDYQLVHKPLLPSVLCN